MHAPTSTSTVPCHAVRCFYVQSTTLSFCSGCKRCTQQVGSKVTFYGSKGKLSSVTVDLLCTRVNKYMYRGADEDHRKWQSVSFTSSEVHPADKLGRTRSPKMLSIPLVIIAGERSEPT